MFSVLIATILMQMKTILLYYANQQMSCVRLAIKGLWELSKVDCLRTL